MILRIGTRASALARWQAEWVSAQFAPARRGGRTDADRHDGRQMPGTDRDDRRQGVFHQGNPAGFAGRRIDLASTVSRICRPATCLGCAWRRCPSGRRPETCWFAAGAIPSKLCPGREGRHEQSAAPGAIAALPPRPANQGYPRQCRHSIAEARRGRIRRADPGEAGLRRLGLADRIGTSIADSSHSAGRRSRGAGLETRTDDEVACRIATELDHPPTHAAVLADEPC